MSDPVRGKIYNVTRKPTKCPKCGAPVWPIIYENGDTTAIDFLLFYRKNGRMGGDTIHRRPPVWACSTCNARFRKVNPDGSDAEVKVRRLKNERIGNIEINFTH